MMKAEILAGPERRRRWSEEEKVRVVAEATMPGAQLAEIARRHGVSRLHSVRTADGLIPA